MGHLVFWRLAGDVLLFAALGYLCLQFVRSPRINSASRQLRELESALRGLIKEADIAGRSLNDQLLRRQQSLEKLLIDAQLAEQRIEQAVTSSSRSAAVSAPERQEPLRERISEPPPVHHQPAAEPASFARAAAHELVADEEEESEITFGNTNIYGEPIAAPAAKSKAPPPMGRAVRRALQTYSHSPLQSRIEKEVDTKPAAAPQPKNTGIEDVYAAAEELLRAGNDLAVVAGRTRLPIEEVRALSQMIIGERSVKQAMTPPVDDADPRLGVMAGMKRQTITL